jgi:hypothetical protein
MAIEAVSVGGLCWRIIIVWEREQVILKHLGIDKKIAA